MKDRLFVKEKSRDAVLWNSDPWTQFYVNESLDQLVGMAEEEIGEYVLVRKHLCRRESRVISREIP